MKNCYEHLANVRTWKSFVKKNMLITLLTFLGTAIYSQNLNLTGKVTDQTQEVMIGVNIMIKGTTTGTVSDFEGSYSLPVNANDTLLVSYIGYMAQEIAVNGRSKIDIVLQADLQDIDEVVVVGYGVQKKSEVTGSIASIKTEDLKNMKASNVTEAMQGRAAGVHITSNSGTPGSSMNINIRGVGTINDSEPLWVIDGVPSGGGYVNPSDVESIEILKDAATCAIYGARGANGVILITTKKGEKGKGKVSYDGSYKLGYFPKKLNFTTAKEWAMLREEALVNAGQAVPDEISDWPMLGEGTYWLDEVTQTAATHENNLSFSGANDNFSYFLSVNHLDQEGVVKKSNYKRTTLRLNTSYKMNNWLTIGENLAIANEVTNRINEDDEWNAVLIQAIAIDPITTPRKPDGTWAGSNYNTMNNPVAHLDRTNNENDNYDVGGNLFLDIDIFEGLKFRTDLGINNSFGTDWVWDPTFKVKTGEERSQNALYEGFYKSRQATWTNFFTYSKTILDHTFSVMAGTENMDLYSNWFDTRVTDLVSETPRLLTIDYANGNNAAASSGSYYSKKMASIFSRLTYSYRGKYMLTANMRRDGSSIFGPDKRYGLFPSASFGWNVKDESFMENVWFVNRLKLRLGWGKIGNDRIEPNEWISSATTGKQYVFGNTIVNGASFMKVPNPEVAWETTITSNIGIDASFFDNQFTTTLDFYNKKTSGMLVDPPVQGHVGAESPTFQNVGDMSNKGIEIELGYKKQLGDLKIDVVASGAYNKNEVVNLGNTDYILDGEFMGLGYITRTEIGHPVASFYGFLTDGLFQNQAEIDAHVGPDGELLQPNAAPGDIRYKDRDGDGELDQDFIGSPIPDFIYGLNTRLEYKGFDFNLFLQGVQGVDVFNATRFYTQNSSIRYNSDPSMLDRWIYEGSTNDVNTPRVNIADANNSKKSDRFVEDGSYLRVKSVQLGYTVPTNLLKGKVDKIRVYIGANNLHTFTKYTGFDPEVGKGYDQRPLDLGIDRARYPNPRTFLAGINVIF